MNETTSLSRAEMLRAMTNRDSRYDGRFITGVLSTGIYCIPSCPARKPLSKNVRFFPTASLASESGLRACLRCHPDRFAANSRWATEDFLEQFQDLDLRSVRTTQDLARALNVGLTKLTADALRFTQSSPAELLSARRIRLARELIEQGGSPTVAADSAGYKSLATYYRHFRAHTGTSPGNYRKSHVMDHALDLTNDLEAFNAVLSKADPAAPTACTDWDVHHVLAHATAGFNALSTPLEASLSGSQAPPTITDLDQRESSYRALDHAELNALWIKESSRLTSALTKLADAPLTPVEFAGRDWSPSLIFRHAQSELTLHRYDIAGFDQTALAQLCRPELLAHALNQMAPALITRSTASGDYHHALVAPGQPAVLIKGGQEALTIELGEPTGHISAKFETAAHRLLFIWGRHREISLVAPFDRLSGLFAGY